jgi:glutamyl-tRNA reductase
MNTLTDLKKVFIDAIRQGHIYIGVAVKLPNLESPEIIINPMENFEEKLKYYKNAYDENLVLKTCNDIEIVGAYGSDYADDIVGILE